LEGLMSTKYLLSGCGQVVSTYAGSVPKPFLHEELSCEGLSMLTGEQL